ncbi:MAG: extensin family protein, partial [Myxococcales bacterium]|nr:extensin family protein [Myxococcales bacterium]
GTGNPETRDALLKSAKRGAGGWPQWLWNFEQPVLADTEVTDAVLASANVVLYTTGADNAVYTRLRDKLPIQITADGVRIGAKTHSGKDVGTRFIYPNPLAPNRYVVVQGGPTPAAVDAGHRLPDFVPDYVIYDKASTQTRPRLVSSKPPLELGFFDDTWHLPAGFGNTATGAATPVGGEHAEGAELAPTFTESSLPVPEAPPAPPAPTTFLAAASDPAGKAARAMAKRIASFPSFRTTIRGATWNTNAGAVWQVRPGAACEAALAKAGVPFRAAPADKPMATPVATPVVITGPIQGVAFRMLHADRELVMSCELATRLPALAGALRARGVRKVGVISTYRDHPTVSFHTFGLAIDISQFSTDSDTLSVEKDFPATPNQETCKAKPSGNPRGDTLRAIVCDVAKLGVFSSVLTPNYNAGHRDHVHLDLRPDDPRQFLR